MRFCFILAALLLFAAPAFALDQANPENGPRTVEAPPVQDTAAVLDWTAKSTEDVMSFGYTDYQRRLQQASKHFTKAGWESFAASMQKSRIIEAVTSSQQLVSATAETPVLLKEETVDGIHKWWVKETLNVTYQSEKTTHVDVLKLNLRIEQVPRRETPQGLGIALWEPEPPSK